MCASACKNSKINGKQTNMEMMTFVQSQLRRNYYRVQFGFSPEFPLNTYNILDLLKNQFEQKIAGMVRKSKQISPRSPRSFLGIIFPDAFMLRFFQSAKLIAEIFLHTIDANQTVSFYWNLRSFLSTSFFFSLETMPSIYS